MTPTTITILKSQVFDEVSQTTAYAGAKMGEYALVSTTDADASQLQRFWSESCDAICTSLRPLIVHEVRSDVSFEISLGISCAVDANVSESLHSALFSFCVNSITAKWFGFCNKADAQAYCQAACDMLDNAKRQALCKRRPNRPHF